VTGDMRAVVIARPGGPEVLELRSVPAPEPGVHEVLVRVRATALNRADLLQRQGKYPAPPGSPQDIPGMEMAGEVVGHGPEARRWPIGARVFGIVGGGAYAELVTTHEDALAEIPADLSWTDAAAVPEAFITAHDALVTQGGMHGGDTVLIHAVASGVGLAAVQLARAWGATAYGTTRTADKLARARTLGLTDGIVVTNGLDVLEPAVKRWTNGHGIDVTLELVGGSYFVASIAAAAHKGRIILVGTMGGGTADVPLGVVMRKRLMIRGTMLRSRSIAEKVDATERFAREVLPLVAAKKVQAVVDRVFALEDAAAAHRLMESNQTVGKIVLSLSK
jgi:putative PIG3 family NAD(P)H quinone oxidoreductase